MASLRLLFIAIVVFAAGAVSNVQSANAQGTTVVVIDQARIMRESAAGQDIATKIAEIRDQMAAELKPTGDALSTEGTAIQVRTENMSRETILADAALVQQIEAFEQKRAAFQRDQSIRAQELAATEQNALGALVQALEPVLQQVLAEKSADIMIDRSAVLLVGDGVDVSDLVISKLNVTTPVITVTRVRAPTAPPAQ